MSLKVLHLWNMTAGRCGIRNFGNMFSIALRNAGCEVDDFDVCYPTLYATGKYLPDNVQDYDVVHFNWHPITNNHYGAGHFTGIHGVRSIYLHDIPPWSACPCLEPFQVRMTSEPSEISTLEVPYPIVDWVDPATLHTPGARFTVGISGVREDGFPAIRGICDSHNWLVNMSEPGAWLSIEDEVRRLSRSHVNVCWYHEARGLSGTPGMMLGSRRPLLINHSPMLRHLRDVHGVWQNDDLEKALMLFEAFPVKGPQGIDPTLSWSTYAQRILMAWEEAATDGR